MKRILTILVVMILSVLSMMGESITAVQPTVGSGTEASPYEIASAANLVWFAQQVNGGSNTICGKLTADIDLGDDQTMIGTETYRYKGVFDGQHHTVTIHYVSNEDYTALFRFTYSAIIKNVNTDGSITTSARYAGGIVGDGGSEYHGRMKTPLEAEAGPIMNCGSSVTITSTYEGAAYHGGIVGSLSKGGCNLICCSFTGSMLGEKSTSCGGLIGMSVYDIYINSCLFLPKELTVDATGSYTLWGTTDDRKAYILDGGVSNTYYSVTLGTVQGTQTNADDLKSGRLCSLLNRTLSDGTQAWYQTLGSDDKPVLDPSHKTVYYGVAACPVTLTYSNNTHTTSGTYDEDGLDKCTQCNGYKYQPAEYKDLYQQINNKGNLIWYSQFAPTKFKYLWEAADMAETDAKLNCDIDLSDTQVMIGTDEFYVGGLGSGPTFDGQGHTIKINYISTGDYTALFHNVGGYTIKNLHVTGSITTSHRYAGGIIGMADYVTISGCLCDVVIKSTVNGDGHHAGLIAKHVGYDDSAKADINNSRFTGKILGSNTTGCSGFIAEEIGARAPITNSYFYPTEITVSLDNTLCSNARISNCYYLNTFGEAQNTQGTSATAEEFANGKVCYALSSYEKNSVWRQNLTGDDVDALPVADVTHAVVNRYVHNYADEYYYGNSSHEIVCNTYDADGIGRCEVCSNKVYKTPDVVDDVYQIKSVNDLNAFASMVSVGNADIKGKLLQDISLGDAQTMIGTKTNAFSGTFDGNGHTITVAYSNTTDSYTAFFRYTDGAKINNLTTAGTISTSAQYAAGIVANSKNTTLCNCFSSVALTSSISGEGIHGGLIAYSTDNTSLTNCIFTGSLAGESTTDCGGLIGWNNSTLTLTSCLFAPSSVTLAASGSCTLARGTNAPTITNSGYTQPLGTEQGTSLAADALTSGAATCLLNGFVDDGTQSWYQNINNGKAVDTMPVLDSSHGTVYSGEKSCPSTLSYSNRTHQQGTTYNADGYLQCDNADNGCALAYPVYQKPETEDGKYLISNRGNLIWFANAVNEGTGTQYAARLTANINLDDNQVMIGSAENPYKGNFDGDEHTVTVNYSSTEPYTAFFRYIGDGATITDINVAGRITTTAQYAAGIVAHSNGGSISNCCSSVDISSSINGALYLAGIDANALSQTLIQNCEFIGSIVAHDAMNCGGLVAASDGTLQLYSSLFFPTEISINATESYTLAGGSPTIENCYNTTRFGIEQGTNVTAAQLASGEVCYLLNAETSSATSAWRQNLNGENADTYPIPFMSHSIVYGGSDACPSTLYYSNLAHKYPAEYNDNGEMTCSECKNIAYQPATKDGTETSPEYLINNRGNLVWIAQQIDQNVEGFSTMSIKLMDDIDMGSNQTMIGTSAHPYCGTFDGNSHTITVHYDTTEPYTALFRYAGVRTGNHATIKNLSTSGAITTTGQYAGGIVANANDLTLEHCQSSVAITSSYDGDGKSAGLVAIDNGRSTITDCLFTGSFTGPNTYNWSGIVGVGSNEPCLNSCLFAPSAIDISTTTASYAITNFSSPYSGGNCYYVMPETYSGKMEISGNDKKTKNSTLAELAEGLVCYNLNDGTCDGTQAWYQTLSTDRIPVLDNTHLTVYAGDDACPSTLSYSNKTHDFIDVNGNSSCQTKGCAKHIVEPFSITADGYTRIKFEKIESTEGSITTTLEYTENPYASEPKWQDYTYGDFVQIHKDVPVYYRAKETNGTNTTFSVDNYNYIKFSTDATLNANVAANGDVMSLLSSDPLAVPSKYAFYGLFKDCTQLTKAPELGAWSLSDHCYASMFNGCTGLTSAPALPVTTLAYACYDGMFSGCTGLTSAPTLSATTLAEACCMRMFSGCTALKSAPALPAEKVEKQSYYQMFTGCSALETAPVISANEMGEESCKWMFENCTSLKTAPALPAMTLAYECYAMMFENCTGVVSLPELPATTLANSCYYKMFDGCTNLKVNTLGLGTAWTIPANATEDYYWNTNMFQGTAGNFTGNPVVGTTYYVLDKPYTRSMTNQWGTLVLPFDIDYDSENTNYNLYYLSAASADALTFTEYESKKIAAGTPVVVKKLSGDAIEIAPASNSTFSTTITPSTTCTGWTMDGTYKELTGQKGMYFIAQDKFWKADAAITIAPFRAWFTTTSGNAKSMTIQVADDSDVDAIGEITVDGEIIEGPVYNLNGQMLNAPHKGQINIINGKKVIVM